MEETSGRVRAACSFVPHRSRRSARCAPGAARWFVTGPSLRARRAPLAVAAGCSRVACRAAGAFLRLRSRRRGPAGRPHGARGSACRWRDGDARPRRLHWNANADVLERCVHQQPDVLADAMCEGEQHGVRGIQQPGHDEQQNKLGHGCHAGHHRQPHLHCQQRRAVHHAGADGGVRALPWHSGGLLQRRLPCDPLLRAGGASHVAVFHLHAAGRRHLPQRRILLRLPRPGACEARCVAWRKPDGAVAV